ncbi:MAG: peptidoglycan DD-metalloendopeptidase family protein, partial [Hyphomonadaceae bacterium]|nr:peptidoglycan DD-metalloendopeptidase family protein [Hyphomonadaceae bacterium]
ALAYGAATPAGAPARGVTLRTAAGAAIMAPRAGVVSYAGAFRGYGDIVILDVEGGHSLVLTGLESLQVETGARVSAGQILGAMSSATSSPELYVEVRRNGGPIDPGPWLATGAGGRQRAG